MRLAYWMYEGTANHGVGRIANSLRGVHTVFYGPQGDDYVNPIFTMLERTPDFPSMTTSTVTGQDLAMGTTRLPDTLEQVDSKHNPELIIVNATCSTVLLQENLAAIANQADTDAEVMVFDAQPYTMHEVDAAEALFTQLVKCYAESKPRTEKPSVNLIGPASLGFHVKQDLIALRRVMQTLGVQVNVVAPLGASLDDLKRLPAAWVNVVPYRELGPGAAEYLEKTFGTGMLDEIPIGVQPTLHWLNHLVDMLNQVAKLTGAPEVTMPPLTAFSLDGMSAPSGVPWFARTADMDSFSSKRAFVFGDATHTAGVVRFLHDELGMGIAGAGTYLASHADWLRREIGDYLPDDLLVTDQFQDVATRIEEAMPDLICGTQMERHTGRKYDVPCTVIAPPTHIENHLLGYVPMLGFEGADTLADRVYTSTKLGLERHLIDMFGDAGLDYEQDAAPETATASTNNTNGNGAAVSASNGTSREATEAATGQNAAADVQDGITWTADAERLLSKIPFFVRGRVRKRTETYAAEHGYQTITADVLQEAREALGG